jgi:hypothetical protein
MPATAKPMASEKNISNVSGDSGGKATNLR